MSTENTVETQEEVFNINGIPVPVIIETRAKRNGNGAKVTSYIPKLDSGGIVQFLINLWGSPEKVAAVLIRDVIKPMGHEASSEAYNADTGEFSERLYGESLVQYGEPASRRKGGGLTIRDIQTRLAEIAPEFTTLVGEYTSNEGHFASETSQNRFQALMLEQQQLTAALAEKEKGAGERKAKKASKPKKAAAPVAEAAEIKG